MLLTVSFSAHELQKATDRVLRALLISKVTESSALNPRWLVSIKDNNKSVDHEAYENSFGAIVERASTTTALTIIPKAIISDTKKQTRKREAVTPESDHTTKIHVDKPIKKSRKMRAAAATVSTRDERVRRRQASQPDALPVYHHDKTRRLDQHRNHKKAIVGTNTKVVEKDVVRVPMLTGTLYLYRGRHRHAEFVRTV